MRTSFLALIATLSASCAEPADPEPVGGDSATDGGVSSDSGVTDGGSSDGGSGDSGSGDTGTADGGADSGSADSGSADPCGGVAAGVQVGDCAHDFELTDQYSTTWQLHAQAGKVVMLDFSGFT